MARPSKTQESRPSAAALGPRVRQLRQAMGLPQDRLALSADIDQSALSKFERGVRPLGRGALERIAEVLKLTYDELVKV